MADLAAGATLLGSGGGGDTSTGAILVRRALEQHGPVRLVRAADLDPGAWVVPVAAIGAVTVMVERLPGADEFVAAVRGLERRLGVRAAAVHGLEAGGVNALFPVAVAAWLGLPLVDADGMGRAFPRLDQTLLSLAGVPASPAVLVDTSGNELVVETADDAMVEHLARAALPALGGWAASAMYPMRAVDSVRAALGGSVSGARRLGRLLARARAARGDARAGILAEAGARALFAGEVLEVRQRGRDPLGTVTIAHHRDRGRTLRVEMADEYLLALDDGEPVACVPDLICVLDARSWRPISTEHLAAGQHVDVLGLPAPDRWRGPAAAARAGPAAFGLDMFPAPAGGGAG